MKSDRKKPLPAFDLSPADLVALHNSAGEAAHQGTDEYFRFLEEASSEVEPSLETSAGWSAFDLSRG